MTQGHYVDINRDNLDGWLRLTARVYKDIDIRIKILLEKLASLKNTNKYDYVVEYFLGG